MRWALIGTSSWANHTFAPAIIAADATLAGAAGSEPHNSAAFAQHHGTDCTYASVPELLADETIDVVWVASASHLHAEHAVAALRAGKHVLIEKPLAADVAGATAIAAAAKDSDRLAGVGYQHRFHPAHRRLQELIASGAIGTPALARFRYLVNYGEPVSGWRADPTRSGGWAINDLGTHLLDLVRTMLGDLTLRGSALSAPTFGLSTDDLAVMLFTAGDAAVVIEVATGIDGGQSLIEIVGTEDVATIRGSWGDKATLSTQSITENFPQQDVHRLQVEAFDAACAGSGLWTGGTVGDGLVAVQLISDATLR